jgi:hypothetical protein
MIGTIVRTNPYHTQRIDPVAQGAALVAAGEKSEFKSCILAWHWAGPAASADIELNLYL